MYDNAPWFQISPLKNSNTQFTNKAEKNSVPGIVHKDSEVYGYSKSYAHVVKIGSHSQNVEGEKKPAIVLDETCVNQQDYSTSLMGKVKKFGSLTNLKLSSWIWRMQTAWIRRIRNWSNAFSCEALALIRFSYHRMVKDTHGSAGRGVKLREELGQKGLIVGANVIGRDQPGGDPRLLGGEALDNSRQCPKTSSRKCPVTVPSTRPLSSIDLMRSYGASGGWLEVTCDGGWCRNLARQPPDHA
ncbi:hypothetical protein Tco_1393958 [Tanacetum coccineum]